MGGAAYDSFFLKFTFGVKSAERTTSPLTRVQRRQRTIFDSKMASNYFFSGVFPEKTPIFETARLLLD